MMWLTDIFLDYVPGYNKFRTVSTILVIAELTIPFLGFLAIKELMSEKIDTEVIMKSLKYAIGITGGLGLIFGVVGPYLFDFSSSKDVQLPEFLIAAIESDGASL